MKIMISKTVKVRRRRAAGAVLASMLLVASCGDSDTADAPAETDAPDAAWDNLVAEAQDEGQVVLYLSTAGVEDALKEAFAKDYPDIELITVRSATGDLLARLDQEREADAQGADVAMHIVQTWFEERSDAGDLLPLADGPNSATWADYDELHDDYIRPFSIPYVFGFNTTLVDPFGDPAELLNPELKGLIGSVDLVAPTVMAQNKSWGEYQDGFLEDLAAQEVKFYPSTVPMAQDLAAGEIGVAAIMTAAPIIDLQNQGAPVEYRLADTLATAAYYNAGVLTTAQHPNAGLVLVDWLMSDAAQTVLAEAQGIVGSPVSGLDNVADPDALNFYVESDWTPDKQAAYRSEWEAIFGR